ncbi:MAG: FAD-linked oxidase C-terminal domain-containing protein, partial [Cucumibacter sp.]
APYLPFLSPTSPALLVEIMADSAAALDVEIDRATRAMQAIGPLSEILFTKDPAQQSALWDVRKGLFTSAGAHRKKGSAMLTEDVAVPIHRLADAVDDLRALLDAHGYSDAIIFGHALAGNLHFQMAENFAEPGATERFGKFNDALADLVSLRYEGSLKAEHGTGRAIAPYVEAEWGVRAYQIMRQVKALIEPENLLNPGVILNDDRTVHLKNLKSMTPVDALVDMCIECGFCEKVCPSTGLTFTPRQRIAVARERARLRLSGEDDSALLGMDREYVVAALDTCAACNLCSTVCPVGIETGALVIGERGARRQGEHSVASLAATNSDIIETVVSLAAGAGSLAHIVLGDTIAKTFFGAVTTASFGLVPNGTALRRSPGAPKFTARPTPPSRGTVVYFPSCAARMFGAARTRLGLVPVTEAMVTLIARAGFTPLVPDNIVGQCCGQPFASKGFPEEAEKIGRKLGDALKAKSSRAGAIVTDASTCALHMRHSGLGPAPQDSVAFLLDLLPHLKIARKLSVVAVHHNCSAQRLKEQAAMESLAAACAGKIAPLNSVACCGFAGDKGLFTPELNAHALRHVKDDIPKGCTL